MKRDHWGGASASPLQRYEPENGDGTLSGETIFGTFSDRELRSISMLDFDLLHAFVAVAECGGFRRVAERLHLTSQR